MPPNKGKTVLTGITIGTLGVLLSLLPPVLDLEKNAELEWLFSLRGQVPAPPEVVIVGIDEDTFGALGLPQDLDDWHRSMHADLVDRLIYAGAATIVFDIHFKGAKSPDGDRAFSEAIARAGNVVLLEHIFPPEDIGTYLSDIAPLKPDLNKNHHEPIFATEAAGSAPFPLPVVPALVSGFWSFIRVDEEKVLPTLPVVALQTFALPLHDDFLALLRGARPGKFAHLPQAADQITGGDAMRRFIMDVRHLFRSDPDLSAEISALLQQQEPGPDGARTTSILTALLAVYSGADSQFLNFYGRPRSIATVPYHEVVMADRDTLSALDVAGKAVFVGFSGRTQMGQRDSFYTVFSEDTGMNLSGTEIAATAFANLLRMEPIEPMPRLARLSFVLAWGLALSVILCLLPINVGVIVAVASAASYVFLASAQFNAAAVWLPIIVPTLVQMPVALYAANRHQFKLARLRNKELLSNDLSGLTPEIIKQLELNIAHVAPNEETTGACLSTDIEEYSALVARYAREHRSAEMLALLLEYRAALTGPVARCGGFVRDHTGDSTIGVWPNPEQRKAACEAAVLIREEIDQFNRAKEHPAFPTRIGVDSGQIQLGEIGQPCGFGTQLVAEPANVASRIEDANRYLGTRVLVSGRTLDGLEDAFVSRSVGTFLLKGSEEPLELFELVATAQSGPSREWQDLRRGFADAIAEFRKERWERAAKRFGRLAEQHENDGPTRFYLRLSERYAELGADECWNGVALRLPPGVPA